MRGLRIHNYEVVELLGEGAMGTVWLARHTSTGRRAAIKFLRPELMQDKSAVACFLDESRATRAIRHPNAMGGLLVLRKGIFKGLERCPTDERRFLDGALNRGVYQALAAVPAAKAA